MTRQIFLWPTLILLGTILTLTSILVGNSASGYGFPFPWKTGGCPPPGIAISGSCLLAIGSDWLSFGLDVPFYTVMIYGLVLVNSKYRARRRAQSELTNAHLHIQRSGLYQSRYEEYQPDRICGRSVNLQQ